MSGVWSIENSPYDLVAFVVVENDSSLTVQPGVEIRLNGYGIYIGQNSTGSILASGVHFAGPGFVDFTSSQTARFAGGLDHGSIEDSTFEPNVQVILRPGTNPVIARNDGLTAVRLTTENTIVDSDWTLSKTDLPLWVLDELVIDSDIAFIASNQTFVGPGSILFLRGDEPGSVRSTNSRITDSDFALGPTIILEPGAAPRLSGNTGVPSLLLSPGPVPSRSVIDLSAHSVPYLLNDTLSIGWNSTLRADGVSFIGDGRIEVGEQGPGRIELDRAFFDGAGKVHFGPDATGFVRRSVFERASIVVDQSKPDLSGNRFSGQGTAIAVVKGATPTIHYNDFLDLSTGIQTTNDIALDVRNNYWGHSSGPWAESNPEGQGVKAIGNLTIYPWSTEPETVALAIDRSETPIQSLSLSEIYPNPTSDRVTILFTLARSTEVRVAIHDLLGRQVTVLYDGWKPEGPQLNSYTLSTLQSGLYVVVMTDGFSALSKPLLIVR